MKGSISSGAIALFITIVMVIGFNTLLAMSAKGMDRLLSPLS